MKIIKRLWINVLFGLLAALMVFALFQFGLSPYPQNKTSLADGDVITISGTAPVTFGIYATEAEEHTTLSGNGLAFTTRPGVMDGYYEVSGEITPGTYIASGNSASLTLSENASVSNPGADQRQDDLFWFMVKFFFWLGFIMAFVLTLSFR